MRERQKSERFVLKKVINEGKCERVQRVRRDVGNGRRKQ